MIPDNLRGGCMTRFTGFLIVFQLIYYISLANLKNFGILRLQLDSRYPPFG